MGMERSDGKKDGLDFAARVQLAIIKNENGKRGWIGKNKNENVKRHLKWDGLEKCSERRPRWGAAAHNHNVKKFRG